MQPSNRATFQGSSSPNSANYHSAHLNQRLANSEMRTVLVLKPNISRRWMISGTNIRGREEYIGDSYYKDTVKVALLGQNPKALDNGGKKWTWET